MEEELGGAALLYVVSEVQDQLDRLSALVHVIVDGNIGCKLHQIPNNLFPALREGSLHVRARSSLQHGPHGVLDTPARDANRMVHAVASPFLVGRVLFAKRSGHVVREHIVGVYLRQADQPSFHGPHARLAGARGDMTALRLEQMPSALKLFGPSRHDLLTHPSSERQRPSHQRWRPAEQTP